MSSQIDIVLLSTYALGLEISGLSSHPQNNQDTDQSHTLIASTLASQTRIAGKNEPIHCLLFKNESQSNNLHLSSLGRE